MEHKDLPCLAIECTTEEQYKAIREKLDALGYKADADPSWSDWAYRDRKNASHVICKCNDYGIYIHNGVNPNALTQLTYTDFIDKYGKSEIAEKPSIGLRPRRLAELDRIKEIYAAISRYLDAEKKIPQEWLDELQELNSRQ